MKLFKWQKMSKVQLNKKSWHINIMKKLNKLYIENKLKKN